MRNEPGPAVVEQARVSLLADLRRRLEPLRPRAAAKLAKVTARGLPEGADRLRFEMHDVCDTFAVVLYAEADADPGGNLQATVFDNTAIPAAAGIDWDGLSAAGVEPWQVVQQAIVELVADAWADAGGAGYPLPAVICQHDDAREFDLGRRRWVTDHMGRPLSE